MTKNIEFNEQFKIGDAEVTDVKLKPLTLEQMGGIMTSISGAKKPLVEMQAKRILTQAEFYAGEDIIPVDRPQLGQLPATVAKAIIADLDYDQGKPGKVVAEGDGVSTPIMYRLGTPLKMSNGDQTLEVTELEFMAKTFGELEDVLASDNEVNGALALIQNVAIPHGGGIKLQRLPGYLLDQVTVVDGLTIAAQVLPAF
jgi:hypothetical protein